MHAGSPYDSCPASYIYTVLIHLGLCSPQHNETQHVEAAREVGVNPPARSISALTASCNDISVYKYECLTLPVRRRFMCFHHRLSSPPPPPASSLASKHLHHLQRPQQKQSSKQTGNGRPATVEWERMCYYTEVRTVCRRYAAVEKITIAAQRRCFQHRTTGI